MIISRAIRLGNILNKSRMRFQPSLSNVSARNYHGPVAYRAYSVASAKHKKMAEMMGSILWGWVFYHLINNYDLLLGEYFSPKPALWTDEELGIPPDELGPYVPK